MRVAHASRWRGRQRHQRELAVAAGEARGLELLERRARALGARRARCSASTEPSRSSTLAPPSTPIVYRQRGQEAVPVVAAAGCPRRAWRCRTRSPRAGAARATTSRDLGLQHRRGGRGTACGGPVAVADVDRPRAGRSATIASMRADGVLVEVAGQHAREADALAIDASRRSAATRTAGATENTWSTPNSSITSHTSSEREELVLRQRELRGRPAPPAGARASSRRSAAPAASSAPSRGRSCARRPRRGAARSTRSPATARRG